MREDKEPVHFVTEMHRSIDGKTYKGLGQSRTHNVEAPSCRITIAGLTTGAGEFRIDITHRDTPVVDKHNPAAPASHSGPVAPVDQPVVDLLKTLPIDELRALQKRIVPEALISDLCGHASDELRRRRQQ